MLLKCGPRAFRGGPEPKDDPNRVLKGAPRESQNYLKITVLGDLGHRCATQGPQGLSGHPPKPKITPKWTQMVSTFREKNLCWYMIRPPEN